MPKKPNYVSYNGVSLAVDENMMKRVTQFSADTSFMDEDLLELSNAGVAEHIDDVDTVSVTVDCHEFGSTENIARMVNFFNGTTDTGASANKHYITDASFDNAQVDFMLKVTSGTNNDALLGTCWLGGQYLSGWNMNYSVDGTATESFTLEGDTKRWFMNAYRDTYVFSGTRTSATQATIYGQNLQSTHTARVMTVNGLVVADVRNGDSISMTNSSSNTIVSATPTLALNAGDRIRVVAAKNTPASFTALTSTPNGLGALRRGMIDMYLYNATGNEEKTLRLQSVGINVSLDRTAAAELGNKKNYSRILNRPISVEVSCEAYLDDLETIAKLTNKETEFDAMSLNEIDIDDFVSTSKLVVKIYKSEIYRTAPYLLKTITITNLGISSEGMSVDAGGNAMLSFSLKSTSLSIAGNSISPLL